MLSEQDSLVISSIRFPLAVMVVAIHSYIAIEGWEYSNVVSQGLGSNIAAFFMISISQVLCHIAVPTFFLISGFLFFSNFENGDNEIWRKKIKSRVKSVIIPYFLWIVLYIIYLIIIDYRNVLDIGLYNWLSNKDGLNMFWSSNRWNMDRTDIFGLPAISSSPILVPFWFMRDLTICIILTPVMWWIFRQKSSPLVKAIGILALAFVYFSQLSLMIPGFSGVALFYFGVGALLCLNGKSICTFAQQYNRMSYITFILLLIIEVILYGHNTYWGNIIYPFYVFSGVIFIINFFRNNQVRSTKFERYTFFIFAFHIFILPLVGKAINKMLIFLTNEPTINDLAFANSYPYLIVLDYLLRISITLLASILAYTILERIMPAVCKVLCGKRTSSFKTK